MYLFSQPYCTHSVSPMRLKWPRCWDTQSKILTRWPSLCYFTQVVTCSCIWDISKQIGSYKKRVKKKRFKRRQAKIKTDIKFVFIIVWVNYGERLGQGCVRQRGSCEAKGGILYNKKYSYWCIVENLGWGRRPMRTWWFLIYINSGWS